MKLPIDYTKLNSQTRQKVRNKYCELQNWLCFYCEQDLHDTPPLTITEKKINWNLFPKNFLRYPIHLQHNHDTNMTEGAVHAYCNAVMWQYEGR
tara:strand:- start:182 stop:463 length:282 start_codon:yes stop_codon:yes gene_type:complete